MGCGIIRPSSTCTNAACTLEPVILFIFLALRKYLACARHRFYCRVGVRVPIIPDVFCQNALVEKFNTAKIILILFPGTITYTVSTVPTKTVFLLHALYFTSRAIVKECEPHIVFQILHTMETQNVKNKTGRIYY